MSFTSTLLLAEVDHDPVSERRDAVREALAGDRKVPEPTRGPASELEIRDYYQAQIRKAEGKPERHPARA